ncbi:MAG TPA: hypothetical protein ENN89_02855, partial [Synergistetes bacterium]|nr:hypothetical protein [Synergistota bacterium]
ALGVDVFFGNARFTGPDTIEAGGKKLLFRKAVIATGARAVTPHIDGLEEAGYLTNETVFSITERPSRLAVIGGGPIGCELAQAFQRLGTQVTLFHKYGHILNREDPDAAEIVQESFRREGIDLLLGCSPSRVELTKEGKLVHYSCEGGSLPSSSTRSLPEPVVHPIPKISDWSSREWISTNGKGSW